MITYGHENYIREAIEGVLMQNCDFEVELIVANDCSPDKTDLIIKDIIQNHPRGNWIKYHHHEKNLGMMPNFIFALQQAKGNYIALCDGDDYWIDALKLQKQVDFLELNSNTIACFHNSYFKEDDCLKPNTYRSLRKEGLVTLKEAIIGGGGLYPSSSFTFRNQLQLNFFVIDSKAGDTCLLYSLLPMGQIYYFEDLHCVYRKHDGGVYTRIGTNKALVIENAISDFLILYNSMNLSKKFRKEYRSAIQYKLHVLSATLKWHDVFKLFVLKKHITFNDFFNYYYFKLIK